MEALAQRQRSGATKLWSSKSPPVPAEYGQRPRRTGGPAARQKSDRAGRRRGMEGATFLRMLSVLAWLLVVAAEPASAPAGPAGVAAQGERDGGKDDGKQEGMDAAGLPLLSFNSDMGV